MERDISFLKEDNSSGDVLFQKKYLGFISKILKVFMSAAQKAQVPQNYSLALIKRQSTKGEENKNAEDEGQRFKELSQIMEGQVGEEVIASINMSQMQNRTLLLLQMVVQKEEVSYEDFVILSNSMTLWSNSYMHEATREDLVKEFFANTILKPEDMIFKGVFYPVTTQMGKKLRQEISVNLGQMCLLVSNIENSPLAYYLDLLSKNLPKPGAGNCLEYYDLLGDLVGQSFAPDSKANFSPETLLNNAITNMKLFQRCEDHLNLIGCFKIIKSITEGFPMSKVEAICKGSLIIQINSCLFSNINDAPEFVEIKTVDSDEKVIAQSREAAQDLLDTLCARSKALFLEYLEVCLSPLISRVKRREGWRQNTISESKTGRFVGLRNLGCICYMNSMMQQFYMVPAFRYQMLTADDGLPEDMKEYKGKDIDDNLLHQMQKLMTHLELSERQDYNPFEFCFSFKDFDGQPTNTAIQQDAQEFLNVIFDRIESMLRPTPQKYLLQNIFGGKMINQIICKSCGKVSNRVEDFYNLSLAVKDRKHVYESLDKLIEGEVINDFQCDGCNKKVDIHKRSLISDCPNVLIVHLQRFCFNFDTFRNDKINTYFEFPQILDLTPYSFYDVMSKEKQEKPSPDNTKNEEELWPEEDNCYEYKLVGVTIHSGTANAGHYYSYINTKRGAAESEPTSQMWEQTNLDPWKEFNDSSVTDFNFEKLENECMGGDGKEANDFGMSMMSSSTYGKSAYMLVYERRLKKPIKVLVDKEAAGAVFDAKKEEYYEMKSYNAQGKVVPNKIYKQVWEDNQYIVLEKNVTFVKAVKADEGEDPKMANEVNRTVARIGMKFCLSILAKSYNNDAIKDMAAVFRQTYTNQIDACQDFLEDMCQDNCAMLLDVLLECPDQPFRAEISSIVSIVLGRMYEKEKADRKETVTVEKGEGDKKTSVTYPKALSVRMFYFFLEAMKELATKNWQKLPEYLLVIKSFGETSEDHLRLCFEQGLLRRGLDFILGRKSPLYKATDKRAEMGGYTNQPNFGNLIPLLSNMQSSPLTQEYPLSDVEQQMLFMPQYMK